MRSLARTFPSLVLALVASTLATDRALAVAPLELQIVPMDTTASDFPAPSDGYGSLQLNLLAGEAPRFGVRIARADGAPVPPEASLWLATRVTVHVLPGNHTVNLYGTQRSPFVERLAAVTAATVVQLEPDPTAAGPEGALVFRLPATATLAVGAYDVVALLSPDGLDAVLGPEASDVGGLYSTGPNFRVLDPGLEENKPHAFDRQIQKALAEDRLADALSLADALVARCTGSAVATACSSFRPPGKWK